MEIVLAIYQLPQRLSGYLDLEFSLLKGEDAPERFLMIRNVFLTTHQASLAPIFSYLSWSFLPLVLLLPSQSSLLSTLYPSCFRSFPPHFAPSPPVTPSALSLFNTDSRLNQTQPLYVPIPAKNDVKHLKRVNPAGLS